MSGGHFDYNQHRIGYIADEINDIIEKCGRPKTREELKDESWRSDEWYEKYPEELNWPEYTPEVLERFKEAVYYLERAQVYAHRIDYYLSGDDSKESFLKRLENDLSKIM
jgi:hypothetical protein